MTSAESRPCPTCVYVAHVFVVASLLTAGFMLSTAVQLGPIGPLVIAEALYLAAFAVVVEIGLATRRAFAALARMLSHRDRSNGTKAA